MNDYYNGPSGIVPYTRARASTVNANFEAVAAGFDALPDTEQLERTLLLPAVSPPPRFAVWDGNALGGLAAPTEGGVALHIAGVGPAIVPLSSIFPAGDGTSGFVSEGIWSPDGDVIEEGIWG